MLNHLDDTRVSDFKSIFGFCDRLLSGSHSHMGPRSFLTCSIIKDRKCGFLRRFFSIADTSPTLPEPPTLNDINSVNHLAAFIGLVLKRRYIALAKKLYFNKSIYSFITEASFSESRISLLYPVAVRGRRSILHKLDLCLGKGYL